MTTDRDDLNSNELIDGDLAEDRPEREDDTVAGGGDDAMGHTAGNEDWAGGAFKADVALDIGAETPGPGNGTEALFVPEDSAEFERRWTEVQTEFVDDPRAAVASADDLVSEVIESLSQRFATHKDTLESRWNEGDGVETEDLRQALRHYRAFFHRLLEV